MSEISDNQDNDPFAAFFFRWEELFKTGSVRDASAAGNYGRYQDTEYFSERHLQAVWFDSLYRPVGLKTENNETVVVENPGQWNMEAGPDFLNARLRLGGERTIAGDIEIHINPSDWNSHGHADDPLYSNVIAHVTYMPGVLSGKSLPEAAIQITLKDILAQNPSFCFEAIDISSYPFAIPRKGITPCSQIMGKWTPEEVGKVLRKAGRERIALKTKRMLHNIALKGEDQALYEEIMTALGYKQNRHAFKQLAALVPFEELVAQSHKDMSMAYAMLLGVSGMLPSRLKSSWDEETRIFIRNIWDKWWKLKSLLGRNTMSRYDWNLSAMRPQNHPVRRMAAAASLFTLDPPLKERLCGIKSQTSIRWIESVTLWLEVSFPFWDQRLGLSGRKHDKKFALIGQGRRAAIISNVFVPFSLAQGYCSKDIVDSLPREQDNNLIRLAAFNLLGSDHNRTIYSSGLMQQGLIHILQDFCLPAQSGCGQCQLLSPH